MNRTKQRRAVADETRRPEHEPRPRPKAKPHPAGPHAKPELTDHDAKPGLGTLPEANETSVEPGTG